MRQGISYTILYYSGILYYTILYYTILYYTNPIAVPIAIAIQYDTILDYTILYYSKGLRQGGKLKVRPLTKGKRRQEIRQNSKELIFQIPICGSPFGGTVNTPSPPIKSLDFGGFDSSRLLILRGGNSHVR